jgi:hypothetical protein
MTEAAHLCMFGLDGMRHLGSDPTRPADDIERLVAVHLTRRIGLEERKALRKAGHA